MSISQIMGEDRRPVGEVLLDSVAIMDRLMREAAVPLAKGEPLSADQLNRLLDATRLANHVADVAVKAGATAALVRERERHRDRENQLLTAAVAGVVDGLVDHLISLGIDQRHAFELRAWMLQAAAAGVDGAEPPRLPPVPSEAVAIANVDAGDDHADVAIDGEEDDQDDQHGIAQDDDADDRDDHAHDVAAVTTEAGVEAVDLSPEVTARPGVADLMAYRRAIGPDEHRS